MPIDEMVDGKGGVRPHWRGLIGAVAGLGHSVLAERARLLDRVMAEEGVSGLIPGAAPDRWRFDPIPLPLPEAAFATLAAGLVQRARLLDAVLADIYGAQRLLADGVLPPALVYANPGFLRPCHRPAEALAIDPLQFYAADLLRGPDGAWCVLADHTGLPAGLARALENRRRLGRVLPELFVSQLLCRIEPFMELWLEMLRRVSPGAVAEPERVALLTPGPAAAAWYAHVLLARELSCALVEGGDLTVRNGGLFLKTLRGLQPIGVLVRGIEGRAVDPLELAPDGGGVAGVLAVSDAALRIVNHPGAAFVEAPALVPYLPDLARRLLGEDPVLRSVPTLWLGDAAARQTVRANAEGWWLRPAFAAAVPPVAPDRMAQAGRHASLCRIDAAPWRYAASALVAPSVAPCFEGETLVPRPLLLRLYLVRDRAGWQVMRGGLGQALADEAAVWPRAGRVVTKDIWVLAETSAAADGPVSDRAAPLSIRRTAGDMPSRVADNFYWFGRYLERLEASAILLRSALVRVARPAPAPHELAEIEVLIACLIEAGLLETEVVGGLGSARLGQTLPRAAGSQGPIHAQLRQVSRLMALLRDRLTGQMYRMASRSLRAVEGAFGRIDSRRDGQALDAALLAMSDILAFAATMSGLVAENMVRGGGRLFLDLGRRVERAASVAERVARVLEFPGVAQQPVRAEHGLRLALELCDSLITYRSRYLAVLQPALVLDLLLADEGNPRGLAFQLVTARALLGEIAGSADSSLAAPVTGLLADVHAMVGMVSGAGDQAVAAAALPPGLRALRDAMAELSDRLTRRYFALLPPARTVGVDAAMQTVRGAA